MSVSNIKSILDSKATSELRAEILGNDKLSRDLAKAVADVMAAHGFKPEDDQLVAFEPVVTRMVSDKDFKPLAADSATTTFAPDLSASVHVVETRAPVMNYAITSSAWNG